jgi:methyltransferase (TIGR00027 family)
LNFISFLIFIPLQILFLPLGLVGVFLAAYKQIIVSKRLGSSQTAIEVISGRWTMHVFGIRKDAAAEKLTRALPNASTTGLWLALFPLWVKYKVCRRYFAYPRLPKEGGETIADLIIARTIYFDRIIDRLADDAEQFVVLGAGYDTRAYGELKNRGLTFFELDQFETQRNKIEQLGKANIDSSHVKFVSVDFTQNRVFDKLEESGYDTAKKTIFLWEGVTLYLSENDVRKMLQEIGMNAVSGSTVVADFYGDRFIQIGKTKAGKKTLDFTNEGLSFGLPLNTNHESIFNRFITSENLGVGETYFMGAADNKGPFVVVSEINL